MIRKPLRKIKDATMAKRVRRKLSIRKKIAGTDERPRICITRSNKNIFVQVIDDSAGKTICSAQTFGKNGLKAGCNIEGGKVVGAKIAELLKTKKVESAVFDRAGYRYTGIVAAVADSIRENGIRI